ncbi:MAG: hypothetical protein ABH803_03495 [Candidatus Micrarchaeota archaeon]
MLYYADLHLHSKYSQAVSKNCDLKHLRDGALKKGLQILGTGDFTHPEWFKELKENLVESKHKGFYYYQNNEDVLFTLSCEVANFYNDGKPRKTHNIIHTPSIEEAEQLNDLLSKKSNLSADGRPMLAKTSNAELVELVESASENNYLIPAHCFPPDALVHTDKEIKEISEISIGDKVLTHKGRWRKVTEKFERPFDGELIKVVPYYFREGIKTTPEHPVFGVKSVKNCNWTGGICKPTCSEKACKKKFFEKYSCEWIPAKNLQKGDFLVFPKIKTIQDLERIYLSDFVKCGTINDKKLKPLSSRGKEINNEIKITPNFCRLIGYYLAEGYINSNRDSIAFSFHTEEKTFLKDIKKIIFETFGLQKHTVLKNESKGLEIVYYSKPLALFFEKFCYNGVKNAKGKKIPSKFMFLPKEKQAELLRGWWRGDKGYTISRQLAHGMKIICLRLGIIPSIGIDSSESFLKRGKHLIGNREIKPTSDLIVFSNLSFFEDEGKLLNDASFKKFNTKKKTRHGWTDEENFYLPIRKISNEKYSGKVLNLEVEEDNSYTLDFACVHNCWTPWFGVFGSKSGSNSLKEAFQDKKKSIFAIETGLSSDPEMNWRLSELDEIALVSNSDAHSPYPWRLGRECNAFEFEEKELSYYNLFKAIREKNNHFAFTIEVDPPYGKYHFDGHRSCDFSCSPEETKKLNGICPVCKKRLTIGVQNRVEELADRPEGFKPKNAVKFKKLLPLHELLSSVLNTGLYSKTVFVEAAKLSVLGNELFVLLEASEKQLLSKTSQQVTNAIIQNRKQELKIKPGFDGEYGKIIS